MATEEEAREATDGQEVQMEAADHLQTQLDIKLSTVKEIKGEAQITDSTEGLLKIPEDQVLVEAPSETETSSEHDLNGMASSLNGHVDKEENILNEHPHEINQESQEKVEASPDGTSTYLSNKSNEEEEIDFISHGDIASKDTALLKCENAEPKDHGQQGSEGHVTNGNKEQEENLKIDNAMEQTVDAQQYLETSKATNDTQPASMENIPDNAVVAEASSGVQSPLEPNADDSDVHPDTINGNTETDEQEKADDIAYLDHKKSFPEDKEIAEHEDKTVKVEDQQSKQADDMDADVLHEEIPESKESDVPKTEQVDEASVDDQKALNQEPAVETSDGLSVKAEETCHQSNVATCGERTPEDDVTTGEPTVDTKEVQNQESVEEMKEAEAVDTEEMVRQSTVAFDDVIQDHAATTDPSSDIQHIQNVETEEIKDPSAVNAEEVSSQSNVAFAEDAVQDKVIPSEPPADILPVQGLEQEATENTDEASNKRDPVIFSNLNQEDVIAASEPHVTELAEEAAVFSNVDQEGGIAASDPHVTELEEEAKEIEGTEANEINHQCHAAVSNELLVEDNSTASEPHHDDIQHPLEQDSVEVEDTEAAEIQGICHERTIATSEDTLEDNVTAEAPACVSQEVQDVESAEEVRDSKAENVVEASDVPNVDDADQENNVLTSENIAEHQLQDLESEEIKSEPFETEADFNQRHGPPFNDPAEEDNTTACETQKTESAVEIKETADTKTEAIPQESNVSIFEEPTPEDNITASETTLSTRELTIARSAEAIEDNKDTKTGEISDQSNEVFAGEAAKGKGMLENESTADTQELESEEMNKTELVDVSETFHQKDDAVSQKQNQEDSPTTSELHVTESAGEVSSVEASALQATPQQSNVTHCEEEATEENITESEPKILETVSVQDMKDVEATEPEHISQQSIVSTSEKSVPEENTTAKEPAYDNKEIHNHEPELIKEHDDVKAEEIFNQSCGAIVEETAQETNLLASEPTNDVQVKELESEQIRNTVDVETEEASHQTHDAAVEYNWTASEPEMIESSEQMRDTGSTGPEPTQDSNVASLEEIATQDNAAIEQVGCQQLQKQESVEFKETEALEPQGVTPSDNVSTSEEFDSQETITKDEPSSDTQAEESSAVIKDTEDVKSSAALAEEAAPEEHVLPTEATADTLPVQEPELKETKNIESVEAEDNLAASGLPGEEMDNKAIETEAIPHESTTTGIKELSEEVESDVALADGASPEEHILETEVAVDISSVQEPELEEIKNTEAAEQEHNISTSEEFNPQETVTKDETNSGTEAEESSVVIKNTEDVKSSAEEAALEEHVLPTEATADTPPVEEPELEEIKNVESVEAEENIAASDLPGEEMDNKAIETEAIPHASTTAGIKECTEEVKSNVALAEEAAPEEHILETEVAVDISSVQEPELEEIKNIEPAEQEHNITASGLPEEVMDNEAMKTEIIPHDSNVASIKELTEDDIITASAPDADTQQVPEQESIEDVKCIDTTEHPGETSQSTFSTSDELTPTGQKIIVTETTFDTQQVHSLTDQETKDTQYIKTEEFSEHSTFSTPEEAVQESDLLKSESASDVQQVQQLDSAEETRGTEDYQQNGASTFEETTLENNVTEVEPNVDDQHVQEDKAVVEVKENEAMKTEEISKQINFTTSDNAAQESSETGSDRAFYVQPEQQIELNKDSEDNQLIEAEETSSQSNIVTLEDPAAEDRVANEIEPSVDINQEHELEFVEEIKDTDATEAEEASHTGQAVSSEEQLSESNVLTRDIQQVNELDATQEMKGTEDISGEEICNQQTGTSEDPSPTDNGTAAQHYTVESNEENLDDGIDDVISVHEKIKDEIQESAELKDEASELGEKTLISENRTEEDDVHISTEDTIETSNNINPIKEEPKNVVLQTQVCERSVDTIVIGQQDEAVKNVSLDQQQEDEGIDKEKEELQTDEQKHDDKRADFIIGTQAEPIDVFEAEQTDTVVTEMLKNEVTQHISKDSIPRIADAMVENITEIKEEIGDENGPNNEGSLEVATESYNDNVQESTEKDAVVAKTSSSEHDENIGEIRNEQVEPCLASSVERDLQADSDLSNDQMLDNVGFVENPLVVPQNDEYRMHAEEKEYTDKVNVDMHDIQESDKVIVDEAEEKQGMQNEDKVVRHDEFLITPEKEETSQLHSSEQYSVDTKMNDSTISYAEMTHENTSTQSREIEDTEEKKGFSAISDFVVETSKQNDVEQDFSTHHQVEDEKLSATEHNAVDVEPMQPKVDLSIAETTSDNINNPLPEHEIETASDINKKREYQEATNADDVMQLEPEGKMQLEPEDNAVDKTADCIEKMETSYTEATEVVTCNEDTCDKASGADGVPSEESLETFEDTRRNLDGSSVVTESKGENMSKETEDHKLAHTVHPTQDKDTTEQALCLDDTEKEFTSPEKALPSEPEEQEENEVTKEQDEDDRHDPEICDVQKEQKEAEQDYLPVSSFLMNLILGKESNDPNRNSETEVEKKQEETMDDDSCLIASQQEESLVSFPLENMTDEKLIFEQEKENVKGSEETHEPVKGQSHDIKLDIERSLETDEELKRNTHDLEALAYQDNAQDEISSKLISAEAAGLIEKIEARSFELDEKPFDTVCQESVEAATEIEEGSLKSNQDGTTNPETSQQCVLEEGETELPHESLHEDRSSDAMAEQALSLIEPDIGDATELPSDADTVQNPPCTKQEESTESSYVELRSIMEAQVESEEVEKKEENQHTIASGDTNDDMWKGTGSEAISDEQASEITDQVSHAEINFAYEKEIPASSTCMDKKESDMFSNNEVSNFEKALEIHSDSPKLPVNQDKQDESADNQIVMEHNSLLDKPEEINLQEQQKTDIEQKFPKDTDEGKQKFMAMTEPVIKEDVHETVESHMQTVKIKSNEEQEVFDSQVQERGLDVVSPKAAPEVEENFVEITKSEFSTDEEQSPKADESKIPEDRTYNEKTKDEGGTNNITDEATVKIEEQGTGQKASHKKHSILSGVGSKVKHQLAKVKKAIIGKPGHTKSESPKS